MVDTLTELCSMLAGLMFILGTIQQLVPPSSYKRIKSLWHRLENYFYPYVQITIDEYSNDKRNEVYALIKVYLGTKSNKDAKYLKAEMFKKSKSLAVILDEGEEVIDEFHGVKLKYVEAHQFRHPATFDTLSMDPKKKEEIIDDLIAFSKGKDYYAKVGKAWKRGYLLYGPPGTGKSTMIAAIANFLNYDIYDLELTSVMDNSMLKKLLMETTSKSIIVIEDIDCSIDLTGKRKKRKKRKKKETTSDEDEEDSDSASDKESNNKESGKLTLSGLLNFIDGLWSACGQERIIIFTTNHVDKLDPALIRRGRMDMHIGMSYCKYEAFKGLAKNYLGIETHPLFQEIQRLLEEVDVSPCDVAENLMPKNDSGTPEVCLDNLIQVLNKAKKKARLNSHKNKKFSTKLVKTCGRFKMLFE
ncbi:unnamed protein product [Withania somnifera]